MNPLALEVREYVKALIGGLTATLALLAGALGDGLSAQETVGLLGAFVAGFGAVFLAPNKEAPVGRPADPGLSEQRGEAGYGTLGTIGAVLLILALILLVAKLLLLIAVSYVALVIIAGLGLALLLVDGSARV